jgi:hypothetical protein
VWRSRTRHRRARLLSPLPRRRVAVFFLLADEPHQPSSPTPALRPVATEVRTSFSFPPRTPRPSSRGVGRVVRTAPPPLVMPAIEPGLGISCALSTARFPFLASFTHLLSLAPCRCRGLSRHRGRDPGMRMCVPSRTPMCRCTRARAHAVERAKAVPLALPSPLAPNLVVPLTAPLWPSPCKLP